MNEEIKEKEEVVEEIPEELFAPIGDKTFTNVAKNEETESEQPAVTDNYKLNHPDTPEIISYKDVKLEYSKKPINYKKIFITIFVLILLGIIGFGVYRFLTNKKLILYKAAENTYSYISDIVYDVKDGPYLNFSDTKAFRTSFIYDMGITYDKELIDFETASLLDTLDNIKFNETLEIDKKNNLLKHSFRSTYSGNKMFEMYGYGDIDGFNFKIKDVLGKYLRVPTTHLSKLLEEDGSTKTRTNLISKKIIKSVFNKINEEDLEKIKDKINIDGKEIEVNRISYTLNDSEMSSLLLAVLNELRADEEFINEGSTLFGITNAEFINEIDNLSDSIETNANILNNKPFTINIYTKGIFNKIVKYEVKTDDYIIEYTNGSKVKEISIKESEKTLYSISTDSNDPEKIKYNIVFKDYKIEATKLLNEDKVVYEYSIEGFKDKLVSGNIIFEKDQANHSLAGSIRINFNEYTKDDMEIINFSSTLTYNVKEEDDLEKDDDVEEVYYSDLTEDDKLEMKNRILNNDHMNSFIENLEAYMNKEK